MAAGPAAEPAAAPSLPSEVGDFGDTNLPDDGGAWVDTLPPPAPVGRWTPEKVAPLVAVPFDMLFRATEKELLTDAERRELGEGWAGVFNDLLSRIDPNSPYGAAVMATALVVAPRYLPDLLGGIRSAGPAVVAEDEAPPSGARAFAWGG